MSTELQHHGTGSAIEVSGIRPLYTWIRLRVGLPGISVLYSDRETNQTAAQILSGPFSGSQTIKALDALVKEAQGNELDSISKSIAIAVSCCKRICDEVVNDTTTRHYIPEFDSQVVNDNPVSRPVQPRVLWSAAIGTNDVRNFSNYPEHEKPSWDRYGDDLNSAPIYIGHLSSGTEATLLWIQWLALKVLHYYGFADGWEKQPAILLIDEIENHLHPTWQRRVIPALLEHFPGLQIFATTHSPFVVAGREVGQVHQLIRDTNGRITAKTNTEPIKGLTADEIFPEVPGSAGTQPTLLRRKQRQSCGNCGMKGRVIRRMPRLRVRRGCRTNCGGWWTGTCWPGGRWRGDARISPGGSGKRWNAGAKKKN